MARYHLSEDGQPRKCSAFLRKCPLGEVIHYDNLESAQAAYEYSMSESVLRFRSFRKRQAKLDLSDLDLSLFPQDDLAREATSDKTRKDGRMTSFPEYFDKLDHITRQTLEIYLGQMHVKMNEILRGDRDIMESVDLSLTTGKSYLEMVSILENHIRENRNGKELVYRGVEIKGELPELQLKDWLARIEPGDTLEWKAFTSTSVGIRTGMKFAKKGGVVFEIISETGSFLDSAEEEVLIQRNRRFVFVKSLTSNIYGQEVNIVQLAEVE